jgi:hypothetical protein
MSTHETVITQRFVNDKTPGYTPDHCYLDWYSKAEQVVQPIPSDRSKLEEFQEEVIQLITSREQQEQPHLMIRNPEAVQLIFGTRGGICLTMGISDYSDFTQGHVELGHLVHEFQDGPDTYLTLVHRTMAKQLKGVAERIFEINYGRLPTDVFLRITSKTDTKPILTNCTPGDTQLGKYLSLRDITGEVTDDQFKGFTLKTKLQVPGDVDVAELTSEVEQLAEDADMSVQVKVSEHS